MRACGAIFFFFLARLRRDFPLFFFARLRRDFPIFFARLRRDFPYFFSRAYGAIFQKKNLTRLWRDFPFSRAVLASQHVAVFSVSDSRENKINF
jgi:hypothetical protein